MYKKSLVPIADCLSAPGGFLQIPRALALNPTIAPESKSLYLSMLHHSTARKNPGCVSTATRWQTRRETGLNMKAISKARRELAQWKWIARRGIKQQHQFFLRTHKHALPTDPRFAP